MREKTWYSVQPEYILWPFQGQNGDPDQYESIHRLSQRMRCASCRKQIYSAFFEASDGAKYCLTVSVQNDWHP